MNKSKAEPVSSGVTHARGQSRCVVWSLIFIMLGVCLVNAEVHEDQANKEIAREDHPVHKDALLWTKKRMTMWEEWCLKQKRKNNS